MNKKIVVIISIILCCFLTACKTACTHEYRSTVTTAASCTQSGTMTYSCLHCEDSYTQTIPATDHAYGEGEQKQAPTCTTEGTMLYRCVSCDDTKTEPIPATGHSYDSGEVVREATCAEVGSMEYHCVVCKDTKSESIPMTAHTYAEAVVSREPNCTEPGELSAQCTVCQTVDVVDQIPTNDAHTFTNTVLREPTCIDPGEGQDECSLCGMTVSVTYDLVPHRYGTYHTTEAPSCAKAGTETRACQICGETDARSIKQLPHSWNDTQCGVPVTCTACGLHDADGLEHQYELQKTYEHTSNFAGARDYVCSNCGHEKRIYTGQSGDYDIDGLQAHANALAEGYGFKLVDEAGGYTYAKWGDYFCIVDLNGMSYLTSTVEGLLENAYNQFKGSTQDFSIHIDVSYYTNGAVGSGIFNCTIYINRI